MVSAEAVAEAVAAAMREPSELEQRLIQVFSLVVGGCRTSQCLCRNVKMTRSSSIGSSILSMAWRARLQRLLIFTRITI